KIVEFVNEFMATMIGARFSGRIDHAAQLSRKALAWAGEALESGELEPSVIDDPEPASAMLVLMINSAISLQLNDELDEAFGHFEAANRNARLDIHGFVARNAHGSIAMQLAAAGEVNSSRPWAEREAKYPR